MTEKLQNYIQVGDCWNSLWGRLPALTSTDGNACKTRYLPIHGCSASKHNAFFCSWSAKAAAGVAKRFHYREAPLRPNVLNWSEQFTLDRYMFRNGCESDGWHRVACVERVKPLLHLLASSAGLCFWHHLGCVVQPDGWCRSMVSFPFRYPEKPILGTTHVY